MTPEEIREALETADAVPARALTAAVDQAAALAPAIIDLIDQAAAGVFLLPRQRNLLFYGLHALAAARFTQAMPPFLAMLRQSEEQLDRLFGIEGLPENLAGLLLSLYDGNPDSLYAALEDPVVNGMQRWGIFQALARLVWEERVERDRFVALLDRFDAEEMAPKHDAAWEGWQDAIVYLGLGEFDERVRRGWDAGRIAFQNEADRVEWREALERAAANPDEPVAFDDHVTAIDDPVASLAFLSRWEDDDEDQEDYSEEPDERDDPAADIALSAQEIAWLDDFLTSAKVPDSTMPIEQLDGFLVALAVTPELVLPSEYMRVIWATEDGEGPVFDNREQLAFFHDLLRRHWNTIARRLDAGCPHPPLLAEGRPVDEGSAWAYGFMVGAGLRVKAWEPLLKSKKMGPLVGLISFLANEDPDEVAERDPMDADEYAELVEALSHIPLHIREFWDDRAAGLITEPLRSTKIGRNEPCPCGSGRKYKKCHGAGGRS